jgi:sulfur carrier protein ThiS
VRVSLNPQGRELEVENVARVSDLLSKLNILPGTVLVISNDKLLTEDASLRGTDHVELRSVVSGG